VPRSVPSFPSFPSLPSSPAARSAALAAVAVLAGAGAVVGAYLFLTGKPEPRGDGFAAGMAAIAALLYVLAGLVVAADGVALAGLESRASLVPAQRLVAQVGAVLAAVGPLAIATWVVFDLPVDVTGAGLLSVVAGTLLVGLAVAWVAGEAVVAALRDGSAT
jgi:hypothetical protein